MHGLIGDLSFAIAGRDVRKPGFTMAIGAFALGEMPSLGQVAGFSIAIGFW